MKLVLVKDISVAWYCRDVTRNWKHLFLRAYLHRKVFPEKDGVLLSTGVELIFFFVVDKALPLGFSMKIILTTYHCFSCCLLVLTLIEELLEPWALPVRGAREGGREPGQEMTPAGHRVDPYHRSSCPVYKLWGELDGGLRWLDISWVVRNNKYSPSPPPSSLYYYY